MFVFSEGMPIRMGIHLSFSGVRVCIYRLIYIYIYIHIYIYIYIYIPGTCLSSILVVEPFKTMSFPIKTRVIWVAGMYIHYFDCIYIYINKYIYILLVAKLSSFRVRFKAGQLMKVVWPRWADLDAPWFPWLAALALGWRGSVCVIRKNVVKRLG